MSDNVSGIGWSEIPPSEPGPYWVRDPDRDEEIVMLVRDSAGDLYVHWFDSEGPVSLDSVYQWWIPAIQAPPRNQFADGSHANAPSEARQRP